MARATLGRCRTGGASLRRSFANGDGVAISDVGTRAIRPWRKIQWRFPPDTHGTLRRCQSFLGCGHGEIPAHDGRITVLQRSRAFFEAPSCAGIPELLVLVGEPEEVVCARLDRVPVPTMYGYERRSMTLRVHGRGPLAATASAASRCMLGSTWL